MGKPGGAGLRAGRWAPRAGLGQVLSRAARHWPLVPAEETLLHPALRRLRQEGPTEIASPFWAFGVCFGGWGFL